MSTQSSKRFPLTSSRKYSCFPFLLDFLRSFTCPRNLPCLYAMSAEVGERSLLVLGLPRLGTAICVDMNALPEESGENSSLRGSIHQWVIRANLFPLTFSLSFKRGGRGGTNLVHHFRRFIRSSITPPRFTLWVQSPEIVVRYAVSSSGDCSIRGYSRCP